MRLRFHPNTYPAKEDSQTGMYVLTRVMAYQWYLQLQILSIKRELPCFALDRIPCFRAYALIGAIKFETFEPLAKALRYDF